MKKKDTKECYKCSFKWWMVPAGIVLMVVYSTFLTTTVMADDSGSKPVQHQSYQDLSGFYSDEIVGNGDQKSNRQTDWKHQRFDSDR